ncbi:type A2 lantipeptide [Streptomyces pathocidini]|uniref:type A2 lantipeptide n=1 Tax=Streptomyces pathocidini TaxID=1650571 RepID=UPI003403BD21
MRNDFIETAELADSDLDIVSGGVGVSLPAPVNGVVGTVEGVVPADVAGLAGGVTSTATSTAAGLAPVALPSVPAL